MDSMELIVTNQTTITSPLAGGIEGGLPIGVGADEKYLTRMWDRARASYLHEVLTKKGTELEKLCLNTRDAYKVALQQFFDGTDDLYELWPGIDPWSVSAADVTRFKGIMGAAGKITRRKDRATGEIITRRGPLASASINQKLAAVRGFYDYVQAVFEFPEADFHRPLIEAELLHPRRGGKLALWPSQWRNPVDPKVIKRAEVEAYDRVEFPTTAEAQAMLNQINLDSLSGKRDYALISAYLTTCVRSSALLNLKWGDLRRVKDGSFAFSYRYKGGKIKQANLDPTTYQYIRVYLHADGRLATIKPEDYIFVPLHYMADRPTINPVDLSRPISPSVPRDIVKKLAGRAGVDRAKARVHALRHTGLRLRLEQMQARGNVDYQELMRVAGHSNLNTTMIYIKKVLDDPIDDGLADAAAAFTITRKSRPRKKTPDSQLPLEAAISPEQAEIARLRAELAAAKAKLEGKI